MSEVTNVSSDAAIGIPVETEEAVVLNEEAKKAEEVVHGEPTSSTKQAEIAKEDVQVDVALEQAVETTAETAVAQVVAHEEVETTEEVPAQTEVEVAEVAEEPASVEVEVIQEGDTTIVFGKGNDSEALLDEVTAAFVASVESKPMLPAVNLQKISYKELKGKDGELVKKHAKDEKAIHSIQWDSARNVVVIEKSGKFRAYQIGAGKHPALVESAKKAEVIAHLARI